MKEKIILNDRQKFVKSVLIQIIKKRITTHEAAIRLDWTQRNVEYRVISYKLLGDKSLVHGNTGKNNETRKFRELRMKIADIFLHTQINGKTFEGISYAYFNSILKDFYGITASDSYVRKVLRNECKYLSPRKSKRRDREIHLMRDRKEKRGELVQIDGSSHDWFRDGHKECITGFIDDASGQILSLYMTKNECSFGYHEAFRIMANNYGLPEALYTDGLSVFYTTRNGKVSDKPTQFGRIMNEFGVELIHALSPQAKGRIERLWETLQGQLVFWLWKMGAKTMDDANRLFPLFIQKFNKKYSVRPKSSDSAFVGADSEQINKHLRIVTLGKIDRGGVFDLEGYRFFCNKLVNQKIKICMSVQQGLWIEPLNGSKHFSVVLLETDSSGDMADVKKMLIEKYFLQNAKPKYREVYSELDYNSKYA